ncbi:hypothetical protein NX02_17610 [Sphingomonas sanxanigenens DSM 19645 = NX02]|uniref:Dienelactone hydrolase domain-containing protein n=2 Tax=Sphingomonas sanxanigenens TaxID=397260 RepID=W0ADN7_9SPHN|nr:hypothetical protein NX02_17610 [Sphingomonas sanxanigenens DSM 19645 = NX02]
MMAIGLALLGSSALAQGDGKAPGVAELAQRETESRAADNAMPDTPGTGAYPAIKEIDPTLADHVVYRPKDLAKLGDRKLAVLVWGNGGCSADGASARQHLAEIASHGYLAIAPGEIQSGPDATSTPRDRPADRGTGVKFAVATTWQDVAKGIDWAIAENSRAGSPYRGRIATDQIAVAGHSCGGLQALQIAGDKRIRTVIVHNSGIFADGSNPIAGINVEKSLLETLHTPILYVLGGRGDVAWPNGTDDYARITSVPAVLVDGDVGHGGTFRKPDGGEVAGFALAWLDWQLRGDRQAAKLFAGADCGLCKNPKWRIEKKGF